MRGFKHDNEAVTLWGSAYADIPKSVFAVACWHLANLCSEEPDSPTGALARLADEIEALGLNGCITPEQAARSINALRKATNAKIGGEA